jgi:hypothetical protein
MTCSRTSAAPSAPPRREARITAGAYGLIDPGIADLSRLCIVGWSYGGYAALIGVVKEPQLYRCAAVPNQRVLI